jgi:anthranilate phosphoribosyltransferase
MGVYSLCAHNPLLTESLNVNPELAARQSTAALSSMHNQETYTRDGAAEQIAGICSAIFDYDIGLSESRFLNPDVAIAMDNCGMGGDLYRTPNVSTLAALIAAAEKIPMCKHGSPGNTDSAGSSDFLELSGADLFSPRHFVENNLENICFAYTDALDTRYKKIHLQTHGYANIAHMNDIIGPITNPLSPEILRKRVLGVNHLIEPRVVAEAYNIMNSKGITHLDRGFFVRGFIEENKNGGIDEISVFPGRTNVAELNDGKIICYSLGAEDFGIQTQPYLELPMGRREKVSYGLGILKGKVRDSNRNLVLANAAILEYLFYGKNLKESYARAEQTLDSGRPMELLEAYIDSSRISRGLFKPST